MPPEKEITERDITKSIDTDLDHWIERERIQEVPAVTESFFED